MNDYKIYISDVRRTFKTLWVLSTTSFGSLNNPEESKQASKICLLANEAITLLDFLTLFKFTMIGF